jgi:4-carboxymuconolactone decarboxylase
MARIQPVPIEEASEDVATILEYVRTGFAEMAGGETERMIEPLQVYAHVPGLLRGGVELARANAELSSVPRRYQVLGELRAATLTQCEYCIDLASQVSRQSGLSDEELLGLANYRTSEVFDGVDRLVLDYATGMSRTPVEVSDELFAALREHFDERQMVELTHLIACENMYGRFNHALGIGASGLSEGMVCAVPAVA